MNLEIQTQAPESAKKTHDDDRKLLSLAGYMDLKFGGYQPIGRGYRMHFIRGTVGSLIHFHIPRKSLKKFLSAEVKRMKP